MYSNNINKLNNSGSRELLLAEINKANNKLNQPYRKRVYTEEDMKELLGVK